MTTVSPLLPSSRTHYVKHHEYHTLLPTLLLVDDMMTPNKAIYTQSHASPKQTTLTHISSSKQTTSIHHISSSKQTTSIHHISSPKQTTSKLSSPKQTTHQLSSPKQTTHQVSSPKQTTFSSQSQPPPPPSRTQSSQPSQFQPSSQQSSTLHFLSTHDITPYSTPSCSITLTPFQPCALSHAVEIAVSQFPSLHEIMHPPNRSVHPSLLPTQIHSQSTPTRYRLHPTHRKTPSLPNLSQPQTSMEPLPISSMWETPQYENIAS